MYNYTPPIYKERITVRLAESIVIELRKKFKPSGDFELKKILDRPGFFYKICEQANDKHTRYTGMK